MLIKVTTCVVDKFDEDHDWSLLVIISNFDSAPINMTKWKANLIRCKCKL